MKSDSFSSPFRASSYASMPWVQKAQTTWQTLTQYFRARRQKKPAWCYSATGVTNRYWSKPCNNFLSRNVWVVVVVSWRALSMNECYRDIVARTNNNIESNFWVVLILATIFTQILVDPRGCHTACLSYKSLRKRFVWSKHKRCDEPRAQGPPPSSSGRVLHEQGNGRKYRCFQLCREYI